MSYSKRTFFFLFIASAFYGLLILALAPSPAGAATPIATDSRIRTFVFGESEVFRIITRYGYQTNIEFGLGEEIVTISLGDNVAFRITPAVNRLFIRPMEEDMETNMTVVTNLRTYQFDLSSLKQEADGLMYVVRFYYPEENLDARSFEKIRRTAAAETGNQEELKLLPPTPDATLEPPGESDTPPAPQAFRTSPARDLGASFYSGAGPKADILNYNYTLSGPETIAPVKVFDNRRVTYMKFPNNNANVPLLYRVSPEGVEFPLTTWREGEYVVVNGVFPRYSLRVDSAVVCVFNETMLAELGTAAAAR